MLKSKAEENPKIKDKLWTKDFINVSISNFFMFISFYMLMATFPLYLSDSLNYNESIIGFIIGIFTVSQMISRPYAGYLIDHKGGKLIFIIGRWAFLISIILYLGALSLVIILLVRFLHGASYGLATSAGGAIAAELIPESRRAEGMGYYSIFINLPLVVGPFLGILVIQLGNSYLFITCSIFALLSLIIGYFINIPESTIQSKEKFNIKTLIIPETIPIFLASTFIICVYGGIVSFISL